MAKKKKDKKDGAQADAADSIRAAIERGLHMSAEGAQATRERTRELVDEIASAAGRVRQSLEDMRVLDELRRLRTEIETLGARVAALERPGSSASAAAGSAAAAKPTAGRASGTRAKKATTARKTSSARKSTAAKKTATARKATPRKTAAKKTTTTRSRAKKTAAAAKPATGSTGSTASSS